MKRMPMMRRYERALALVNDQLCFSTLASYELSRRIEVLAADGEEKYTTEVFPENPTAGRLFRKVQDLSLFITKSDATTRRMAVVFGYEHLAAYLVDAQNFRAALQPSSTDTLKKDALEEQVAARIEEWNPRVVTQNYFRTMGYLRHMRNSFAHAQDDASGKLASYAIAHSHELSKFWDNGRTDIGGINFRTLPSEELTEGAAYGLLSLTRICLREVDQMFAATLSEQAVLDASVAKVWQHCPKIRMVPARLAAKVRGAIEAEFGERLPVERIQSAVADFTKARVA
jgi:hypothetical protein